MAREFKLPDLGEGVHEGQIVRLHFKEGDHVKEDQPLMEVETDKAAVEIPCPFTGVIEKWNVKEGQVVHVGDVMVRFGGEGKSEVKEAAARAKPQAAVAQAMAATVAERAGGSVGTRAPASPAVRKLARQLGVDLDSVQGSGPGGRVSREDVERAAKGEAKPTTVVTPVARPARAKPQADSIGGLPDGKDDTDQYGPVRRVPITQARKTIANVMAQSWSTIPHATDTDDADVTELEKLRRGYLSEDREGGPKITMLAFVIRAVVRALEKFPEFNASFDAEKQEVIYRRYINIAVGVHTERGLIAPVIRDANTLSVTDIAIALDEIANKARSASFAVNDTRGGTYTISNPGAVGGSRYSTPIITPPQVAVLAIGRSKWMPWVVSPSLDGGGQAVGEMRRIEPRLIMPLSHSIDHRLLDGGVEVQFLRHVIGHLENPGRLVL